MAGTYSITIQEAFGLVAVNADSDQTAIVMGCASVASGLTTFFASGTAAQTGCGYGDAVDTLCQIIEQPTTTGNGVKKPAAFYGLATVTTGSAGTVDDSAVVGTVAITIDAAVHPRGTYEGYIRFLNDGTIGTTGIQFVDSLDDGRTESTVHQLGTSLNYTNTEAQLKWVFDTGTTVKAGDIARVRTVAPAPDATGVGNAFTALAASSANFAILVCDFECTASLIGTITTGRTALLAAGKRVLILTRTRLPDAATSETDAAWNADCAADYLASYNSGIHLRATYGLVTDAMTSRQYLRSDLQAFAAEVVRVPRSVWPCCPNDQAMNAFTLINSSGTTVGHDEGPRGASTGLSNESLGNRFGCVQRLADPQRMEEVFTTVPWVLYTSGERIRNIQTRRVVNAIEREAVSAGTTNLGGRFRYIPATGTTSAQLSDEARRAIHAIIFRALSGEFKNDISNASDASLDTGLVQVSQSVTTSGGNLLNVPVTIAPKVFGYLLSLPITVAVQL